MNNTHKAGVREIGVRAKPSQKEIGQIKGIPCSFTLQWKSI